jgi:thiamine pyrophosphokinase
MPAKEVDMKAIVVAGGDAVPQDAAQLFGADLVIAADSGARWLDGLGVTPNMLVGDIDSIAPELLAKLEERGVVIERHATDKDASDTELAVERAISAGADQVVVIGALGGERLDHEVANLLLLADESWPSTIREMSIVRGATRVLVAHGGDRVELRGEAGDWVTLLPLAGDAEGVRTQGLRYALNGEALRFGRSRGLSNIVERVPASISLERGTLLVIEISTGGEGR